MSAISEIPLIVPEHHDLNTRRFVITNNLSLEPCQVSGGHAVWERGGLDEEWHSRVHGSVATLIHGHVSTTSSTSDYVLVQCSALPEEPYVLSIMKKNDHSGNSQDEENEAFLSSIEIDLSQISGDIFGSIKKTLIFLHTSHLGDDDDDVLDYDFCIDSDHDETPKGVYYLLLVDSQGNVLRFALDRYNLHPVNTAVQHVSTAQVLENSTSVTKVSSTRINLSPEQITAIDQNRILLAISPSIFCLHLTHPDEPKIALWAKDSCTDNRRSSLGGILKAAGGMLVGRTIEDIQDEQYYLMDASSGYNYYQGNVPTTAALVSIDISYENGLFSEDRMGTMKKTICSLHSDGSVRLWVTLPRSAYPKQVHTIVGMDGPISLHALPSPHLWSSDDDSLVVAGWANVESDGRMKFVVGIGIKITSDICSKQDNEHSPCHISSLEGYLSNSGLLEEGSVSVVKREVPSNVNSIKGISIGYSPKYSWKLKALLSQNIHESVTDFGKKSLYSNITQLPLQKTSIVAYEPSSEESIPLESIDSLDASIEQQHEAFITQRSIFFKEEMKSDDTINEILQRFDQMMMKFIFRSSLPHAFGISRPSDGIIIRALRQTISTNDFNSFSTKSCTRSIEVTTLELMHNGSIGDDPFSFTKRRKIAHDPSTPIKNHASNVTTKSIYHNFMVPVSERPNTPSMDSEDGNMNLDTSNRDYILQQHYQRWEKFIYNLLHEEAKFLLPILFVSIPNKEECYVVRAGISSIFPIVEPSVKDSIEAEIMKCFEKIESISTNRSLISIFLVKVSELISNAKLVCEEEIQCLFEEENALMNRLVIHQDFISTKLLHMIQSLNETDMKSFLSSPYPAHFGCHQSGLPEERIHHKNISQVLFSSARFAQKLLNCCQRFALARFVVFRVYSFGSEDDTLLSRSTLLHSLAMSWICAQQNSRRDVLSIKNDSVVHQIASNKSISKHKLSIKEGKSNSILVSILLGQLSKVQLTGPSFLDTIVALSEEFITTAFGELDSSYQFPLIAFLPNDEIFAQRLMLRVVAPRTVISNVDHRLNSVVANFLLTEIEALCKDKLLSSNKAYTSVLLSLKLLTQSFSVSSDPMTLSQFFRMFTSSSDQMESSIHDDIDDSQVLMLFEFVSHIIQASSIKASEDDIRCFCKYETLRKLMSPWTQIAVEKQSSLLEIVSYDTTDKALEGIITHGIVVLLNACMLSKRLDILGNHASSTGSPVFKSTLSKVIILAIKDTFKFINEHTLTEDHVYYEEYTSLWSSLFQHALVCADWDDAFQACLSNPIHEKRVRNFKQLVLIMADGGAIGHLLEKMIFASTEMVDYSTIDLYEVASQVLKEAAEQHAQNEIVRLNIDTPCTTDYRACLVSLQVCYENWRACCQAMDFFGALSFQSFLQKSKEDLDDGCTDLDSNVMDDLLLSTASTSQFIQMIPQVSERYIVHGEIGPTNILFEDIITERKNPQRDRCDRFLNENSLLIRAKKMIALNCLLHDNICCSSLTDLLQSSDTQIIDALSRLGYYSEAISLAKCKDTAKDGAMPGGCNLFFDALEHILCECLSPTAVGLCRLPLTANDIPESYQSEDDNFRSRPTMNQLRLLLGDGRMSHSRDVWSSIQFVADIERGHAMMDLLYSYTCLFASQYNDLSLRVADKLLDLDSAQSDLPYWLRNLLIGRNVSKHDSIGLFSKEIGDPTALLNLYIRYGLLVDGCDLICEILLDESRVKASTSRLPEQGNIDFVPYERIDRLWNLMDAFIRSPTSGAIEKDLVLCARNRMETSLEKHFELLKISEAGLLSARTLKPK